MASGQGARKQRKVLPAIGRAIARRPLAMRSGPVVKVLERVSRRLTKGRKGILDVAGIPAMEITVPGRRSGVPRTVTLLYVPFSADDTAFLLVGSNWGKPDHPSWSANLLHAERADLHILGERFEVKVRRLTGAERERAWQRAVEFWPGYEMEQRLAGDRVFRLFELTRA
ncbi:nitroreductase family deazaflavin-dependent oxidoreductase [Nocardia sp. NPDC020380]|uniref:nitroreductase family deazaflavin-dependent oxidoreductase n=1 Tax=Nocardia sp. NPDC020380 TaxID=3364309 RepID=UPI0037AD8810